MEYSRSVILAKGRGTENGGIDTDGRLNVGNTTEGIDACGAVEVTIGGKESGGSDSDGNDTAGRPKVGRTSEGKDIEGIENDGRVSTGLGSDGNAIVGSEN